MSSGITGRSHYQLTVLLLLLLLLLRLQLLLWGLMTIVQMLLGRSTSMGTPNHIRLLVEVDVAASAVVVAVVISAAAVAIVIVQVTVGGRHRLITTRIGSSSSRTSNIMPMMHLMALRFALLFHLQLLAQDGGDFALHERPRYRRVGQRALLTTRTVHLGARALSLDALAAAGEAELVVPDRGTLHEVGIFQPFLAEGTFERRIRCGRGGRSSGCAVRCRSVDSWRCSAGSSSWSSWSEGATGTAGRSVWSGDAILWLGLL